MGSPRSRNIPVTETLTKAQRGYLFGRQVLNPSITYGLPTSPSR